METAVWDLHIEPHRAPDRVIVLSDDRVIAEDLSQIVACVAPDVEVALAASLPEAERLLREAAHPLAVLMIEPRLAVADHPLVGAAAETGSWLVVLSEEAATWSEAELKHVLGVRLPFSAASLEPLVSRVVRDRPQG